MLTRSRRTIAAVAVAAASVSVAGVSAASALTGPGPSPTPSSPSLRGDDDVYRRAALRVRTLTTQVELPTQLSVSRRQGVLVADAALDRLIRIGQRRPVAVGPRNGSLPAVDVDRYGNTAFTVTTNTDDDDEDNNGSYLVVRRGERRVLTADLGRFERRHNPDEDQKYGFGSDPTTGPNACKTADLEKAGLDPKPNQPGGEDSNPYAVASVPGGWVVADAGGNDLLFVNYRGRVRELTTLPAQPFTFAKGANLGLDCLNGKTYSFEAVPTDVEYDGDGNLYVSTLPGGPESNALPARGSVYRIPLDTDRDPSDIKLVATGFAGATNIALDEDDRIFVAEHFAGRISVIVGSTKYRVLSLPGVLSLEYADHALYAGSTEDASDGPSTYASRVDGDFGGRGGRDTHDDGYDRDGRDGRDSRDRHHDEDGGGSVVRIDLRRDYDRS